LRGRLGTGCPSDGLEQHVPATIFINSFGRCSIAEVLDDFAEGLGIEGRVADEEGLDLREEFEKEIFLDQPITKHGFHVCLIAAVPSFQFGERLTVWVVVVKVE
jgi:hypothetical protein